MTGCPRDEIVGSCAAYGVVLALLPQVDQLQPYDRQEPG
jgi:hypothetical protein